MSVCSVSVGLLLVRQRSALPWVHSDCDVVLLLLLEQLVVCKALKI